MTLDEAIKHAEEVAEEKDMQAGFDTDYLCYQMSDAERNQYKKCAKEHRQLAGWLEDYKRLLEQELKIKVLDDMEAAKRLGTVDVYMASAWLKFIKDLKILGLRVCEVTESEGEK